MAVNVVTWVWEHAPRDLTPGEMLVALALANHALEDGAHADPTYARLSDQTRLSERTVSRALVSLVEKRFIAIEADATNKNPAMYLFPQFWRDKMSTQDRVGGDKMAPQTPFRGDILSNGGDKMSPAPPFATSASNGRYPRWEQAVGTQKWQAITAAFSDANVQLDAGWLRSTLVAVEEEHPGLPVQNVTHAVRATLFKARDALGRENRIRNPRAFVAKELRSAVLEETTQ